MRSRTTGGLFVAGVIALVTGATTVLVTAASGTGAAFAAEACASATPSATASASATSSASASASASPTATATVSPSATTSPGTASPSPTASPSDGGGLPIPIESIIGGGSPSPSCNPSATPSATGSGSPVPSTSADCTTTTNVDEPDILAGDGDAVFGRGPAGAHLTIYAYTRPSTTYKAVRQGTVGSDGTYATVVGPTRNTRLYAQATNCPAAQSAVINVHTAISISAKRNGPRDYTFSGKTFPGRALIVNLYRDSGTGNPVLTARARADSSGRYAIHRTFTGNGRFVFFTYTGGDLTNAEGASDDRPTVIH
jgi:hypothetical protein